MKVLVVEPGYAPYEKEINGLHEMQAVVGGLIQPIYPYQEQVAVVCNEEGLINGLLFNRSVENGYGGVFADGTLQKGIPQRRNPDRRKGK